MTDAQNVRRNMLLATAAGVPSFLFGVGLTLFDARAAVVFIVVSFIGWIRWCV